jgi:dienelactone hydrolase
MAKFPTGQPLRRPMPRFLVALFALFGSIALLTSCMHHRLIYPEVAPREITTWAEDVDRGSLRMHLEWACPGGPGPFPSVLVHPAAGRTAIDMRGVLWDLASRGYLAVAADYRRMLRGKYRRSLFPWRETSDVTAAINVVRVDRRVDATRLATVGFSQGGVFSLLIAAHAPEVRAVVAYYPVTDFRQWLDQPRPGPLRRFVYRMIRRHFRRESGARDEREFEDFLREASPFQKAELIRAPTLLVHGRDDTTAPLAESVRLADRLAELGRDVRLLVIDGAGHVFNFKDADQAREAWDATLDWLDRHLRPASKDSLNRALEHRGQEGFAAKPLPDHSTSMLPYAEAGQPGSRARDSRTGSMK